MAAPLVRGDVVLTQFPYTDLSGGSVRPALVVSQGQIGQDVVVAGISSVIRGASFPTDHLLDTANPEFAPTGLRVSSVIRVHKLVAVDVSVVLRRLGHIGPNTQGEVDRLLRLVLGL
jgi:mRNA interferase MazF